MSKVATKAKNNIYYQARLHAAETNSLYRNRMKAALELNIDRNRIENIELGRTTPDDDFLKLICNTYNVSYGWLVNGNGEIFQDDGDAQAIVYSVMTGDNEFAKKILVKFAKLSDEHWKQLQEILTELENN